jgi:hypothetical protein
MDPRVADSPELWREVAAGMLSNALESLSA